MKSKTPKQTDELYFSNQYALDIGPDSFFTRAVIVWCRTMPTVPAYQRCLKEHIRAIDNQRKELLKIRKHSVKMETLGSFISEATLALRSHIDQVLDDLKLLKENLSKPFNGRIPSGHSDTAANLFLREATAKIRHSSGRYKGNICWGDIQRLARYYHTHVEYCREPLKSILAQSKDSLKSKTTKYFKNNPQIRSTSQFFSK